ncbi:U6 snRNA-associated Sm-like protein LSm8 [Dysidea avara]|uniref:U6 snRNA-associated Sm-like protein LSm8 n=1 Tax=Dysidea avara TaxID=196820 RepID=UPI0033322C65
MAQAGLESYVNHTVSVVTSDGRVIVGILKGCDQTVNLILENSHERVYSSSAGVEKVPLGLYIIRGDNIAVVGEIDEEMEHEMRFSDIKAEPLNPVVH